jgi:hypothetical protein
VISLKGKPAMTTQVTVFDRYTTRAAIHAQLQRLVQELRVIIAPARAQPVETADLNLKFLSELTYSELKEHDHPVFLLSEICRLLFKSGDQQSLKHALTFRVCSCEFRPD